MFPRRCVLVPFLSSLQLRNKGTTRGNLILCSRFWRKHFGWDQTHKELSPLQRASSVLWEEVSQTQASFPFLSCLTRPFFHVEQMEIGSGISVFTDEDDGAEWCNGRETLTWTKDFCAVHFLSGGFHSFDLQNIQMWQNKSTGPHEKTAVDHGFCNFTDTTFTPLTDEVKTLITTVALQKRCTSPGNDAAKT